MLYVSKAFDRVRYCKLFNELLERNISPVVLRILIYMYMNQTLRVQWCQTLTSSFKVCNGVKQGGVLSPILFAVYVDSLLGRLEQSGVGCHIGGHFVGALAYIYVFIRTYFLQSSTQKMQLYTNRIYKKIIILLKYMNKMNSDMSEN